MVKSEGLSIFPKTGWRIQASIIKDTLLISSLFNNLIGQIIVADQGYEDQINSLLI